MERETRKARTVTPFYDIENDTPAASLSVTDDDAALEGSLEDAQEDLPLQSSMPGMSYVVISFQCILLDLL